MIRPDEMEVIRMFFAFTAGITTLGCGTGIIITWIKRKNSRSVSAPELLNRLSDISDRLSHLDGSIDTMAVEVERISEAQRFTARVLAERASPASLPEPPRASGSKTPH